MKGLLIKDMRLMLSQGRVLFLMLLVVSMLLGIIGTASPSFIVGYITMIMAFFTATTVSYDEYENCYSFLMTLPVTRQNYVNEKYVFGFLTTTTAWLVGMTAGTGLMLAEHRSVSPADWIGECMIYLLMAWIFCGALLPVRLKFEAEKARYVNLIVIVVLAVCISAGSWIASRLPEYVVRNGLSFLNGLGNGGFILLTAGIAAVVTAVSYLASRHIMERKQF